MKIIGQKGKSKRIIVLGVMAIIIVIIVVAFVAGKSIKKENDTGEENLDEEIEQVESVIDMADLSNSEIREDGLKVNESAKIAEGYEFNDMKLEDIKIESTGEMATFTAEVTNNFEKDIEGYIIYITFLKKDGTVIDKVETFFPDIPAGETSYITATTSKDIATAYKIEIERGEV
jgi:hypothetical protein